MPKKTEVNLELVAQICGMAGINGMNKEILLFIFEAIELAETKGEATSLKDVSEVLAKIQRIHGEQ